MFDEIPNKNLRIFVRYVVLVVGALLVGLVGFVVQTLTGFDTGVIRGGAYTLLWLTIMPSLRPWYKG
jgi:hypothetical protein